MDEFWSQDKLILMIGLFQFGLIFIMFIILSVSNRKVSNRKVNNRKVNNDKPNTSDALTDVANNLVNHEINLISALTDRSDQPVASSPDPIANQANLTEIDLTDKVNISPELLTKLWEISDNPAAIVDEAIRWWLRRRNADDLDNGNRNRRYPVGLKSHDLRSSQHLWND
jgi:hypothetical protein